MSKKSYVVIGLERLGKTLVRHLNAMGHEVLAVDHDGGVVQSMSEELPEVHVVRADAREDGVLQDLGVENFDGAVVAVGQENPQAVTLITLRLKRLGVPLVVSRAADKLHGEVLEMVGADRIVQPEREAGARLARTIVSSAVIEYLDLGEDEALIEAKVPETWSGKSLNELELSKLGLTVLAYLPEGKGGRLPRGDTILNEGDMVVIGGPKESLDELELFQEG